MSWSLPLGRVAGIRVQVHATFLLLLAWIGVLHWRAEGTVAAVALGLGFILAVFGCVVLHEFGHALAARRYGIATRDITLLPIGGLARLERMPGDPRQELVVALAGPAVNVLLAGVAFAVLQMTASFTPLDELTVTRGAFVERLLVVNLWLVAFNLLPAFPMDGGRVARALLAMRMEHARATRIAASLGQGMALLFGLLGLLGNPFLLFIALFVWIGAAQEAASTGLKSSLAGWTVAHAMITDFRSLDADDSLGRAVELLLAGTQQDFPVLRDGELVGVLTRTGLLEGLARDGERSPVSVAMTRDIVVAHPGEALEHALERLQRCSCRAVPVLDSGRLVGLVTMENLGEFVSVRTALASRANA